MQMGAVCVVLVVRRKCRLSLRAAQGMSKEEKIKALTCRADVGVKERGYVSACQSVLLLYSNPSCKGEPIGSNPSGGRDIRAKAGIVYDAPSQRPPGERGRAVTLNSPVRLDSVDRMTHERQRRCLLM